jgi:hypothetical protein
MASASGSLRGGGLGSGVGVGSGAAAVSVGRLRRRRARGARRRPDRGGGPAGRGLGLGHDLGRGLLRRGFRGFLAGASETSGFTGWSRTSGAVSTSGSGAARARARCGAPRSAWACRRAAGPARPTASAAAIWSVTSASGASGAGGCGSGSGAARALLRAARRAAELLPGRGPRARRFFHLRRGDGRFQHHRRRLHPRRQGLELRHREDGHAGHLELHLRAVAEQCAAERDPQKDPGMDRRGCVKRPAHGRFTPQVRLGRTRLDVGPARCRSRDRSPGTRRHSARP